MLSGVLKVVSIVGSNRSMQVEYEEHIGEILILIHAFVEDTGEQGKCLRH